MPEVIDAWYDSGAMPFAQWGYPHARARPSASSRPTRRDFICEAIDQTRGWFYTLMAIGTLVFDESSYRERGLPRPHPGRGRPQDVQAPRQHPGADPADGRARRRRGALVHGGRRLAVVGPPGRARQHPGDRPQDAADLLEHRCPSRCSTPARPAGRRPDARRRRRRPAGARPVGAVRGAPARRATSTTALEEFDTQRAGPLLAAYVDDLSNWYVRRSRRRFWDGDPAALATLHECLYVVTLLMAPLMPFITERVWQDLFAATSDELPESVHLAAWPRVDGALVDDELSARRGAGPAAGRARPGRPRRGRRCAPGSRWRRALVGAAGCAALAEELRREVAEELNVGALEPLSAAGGDLVDLQRQGQLPGAGQAVRQADAGGRRGDRGRRRGRARRGAAPPTARPTVVVDGEDVRGARRRGDRHRDAARGLVGGQRAGRDRRARPRAHPRAACGPAWPARSSGWSRRPARPAASRSPTGSRCAGRPTARPADALREHGRAGRRRGARDRRPPASPTTRRQPAPSYATRSWGWPSRWRAALARNARSGHPRAGGPSCGCAGQRVWTRRPRAAT